MNRLKELRLEANLSLRKLQHYVGIDFSRLSKIEKEDCNMESKTLNKLLDFFNVNYTFFMGKDGIITYYAEDGSIINLAFNQFKDIYIEKKYKIIIDKKIKRILSHNLFEKIENQYLIEKNDLNFKLDIIKILKYFDSLDDRKLQIAKEMLNDYFITKKI